MKYNCLTLITARGGSKGLIDKNIKKIGNKTLIEFKYTAAKKAKIKNNDIIVSTDSEKYIKILKKKNIPFLKRSAHLSGDTTESKPVILDVLNKLQLKGKNYRAIILLEPATPFTFYKDLKKGYDLFVKKDLDVMASVEESTVNSLFIAPIKISEII